MAKISKEERRAKLRERQEEDIKNRSGGGGCSWLDLALCPDIKLFEPKPKKSYEIDIIPYLVGDKKKHPQGVDPGYEDWVLEVYVHRRVGPAKKDFICLEKTFGKACPICEEKEIQRKNGVEYEDYKHLVPSRRCAYWINDLKDKDSGVQLFPVSFHLFTKELLEKIAYKEQRSGEKLYIADLEEGCTITFRTSEEKSNQGSYTKFKDFDIVDREDAYDDSALDETFPLNDMLIIPTYAEVNKAFLAQGDDNEEEEKPIKSKPLKKKKVKEEEPEEEEEEVDDEEEEEELEEKPKKKLEKKKVKKEIEVEEEMETEEEEEEDDEAEEEDEPQEDKPKGKKAIKSDSKSTKKQASDKCPHGHKYGVEIDKHKECAKCKEWDACADEFENK
jgi:flagellar biosynthesis GTPase FlhF